MEEGPAQKLRCIDACGQQVHARNMYDPRGFYLCTYVPMMNSNFSNASDEKRFTLRI